MSETIGGLAAPGAGRYRDVLWPSPDRSQDPVDATVGVRANLHLAAQASVGSLATQNAPPAPANVVYNGAPAIRLSGDAANGGNTIGFAPMRLNVRTARQVYVPSKYYDEAYYRVYFVAATDGVAPAVNQDYGFGICNGGPGGAGPLNPGNRWNLGSVRFIDAVTVEYIVRGNNGTIRFNLPALDVTAWHVYEWIVASATPTADASIAFYVDGVAQALGALNSSWAVGGSNVGTPANSPAGYLPFIACIPNTVAKLYISQLRFISGPSLAAVS
jgi:hypothetical protein